MKEKLYLATCDLGSNTFLLTIAELIGSTLSVVVDRCTIVRLKAGSKKNGKLTAIVIKRAMEVLNEYRSIIHHYHPKFMRVVATSALRDFKTDKGMKQQKSIIERFNNALGCNIEIISGSDEGKLAYIGTVMVAKKDAYHFVIDMGGGSTEISLGKGEKLLITKSLDLGIIDWTEKIFPLFSTNQTTYTAC